MNRPHSFWFLLLFCSVTLLAGVSQAQIISEHAAGPLPFDSGCVTDISQGATPLSLSISYVLAYQRDIHEDISALEEPELDKFISIGLQKIANDYLIDIRGWTIKKKMCGSTSKGLQAEVSSPWSSTVLSSDKLSDNIRALLALDQAFTPGTRYRSMAYRWQLASTVTVAPARDDAGALNLRISLHLALEQHNGFSSDKYFAAVGRISSSDLEQFRNRLSQQFLDTYVAVMKQQGVEINGSKKSKLQQKIDQLVGDTP